MDLDLKELASSRKQQTTIIESLQIYDFDDAFEKSMVNNFGHFILLKKMRLIWSFSQSLITKKATQEFTFRIGTKVLSFLVNNIAKRDHLSASFPVRLS